MTPAQRTLAALDEIDRFFTAAAKLDGVFVSLRKPTAKATETALAAAEKKMKHAIPAELRAVYARGFTLGSIGTKESELCANFELLSLKGTVDRLKWWRDPGGYADDEESADPLVKMRVEQRRFGLPIWENDNTVVLDARTGAVSRYSSEPSPSDPIASSLAEWLEHFVAAGCFNMGAAKKRDFDRYWKRVEPCVPRVIERRDNLWLRHLDRWYRGNITK